MNKEVVGSLVVLSMMGCGGGSGSDNGVGEAQSRGFVDSLISDVSQARDLPEAENLSGLWLNVGGSTGTKPTGCGGEERSTYDGKFFELVHIIDNGSNLNVSYCDSGYSWVLPIDGDDNVSLEYRGTTLVGKLVNNNTIDFGTASYSEAGSNLCSGTYEGEHTAQLIKLSNDLDVGVGTINVRGINEDISCAFYEFEVIVDGEGNRKDHAVLGLGIEGDAGAVKHSFHLDRGNLHLDDNDGDIEVNGKTVEVDPVDGEGFQFIFD